MPPGNDTSRLFPHRTVSANTVNVSISQVRYRVGLMGSCFTDVHDYMNCTSSKIHPHYRPDMLENAPGLHVNVSSLPTTEWDAYASLVLVAWFLLLSTMPIHVRRVIFAIRSKQPQVSKTLLAVMRWGLYAQDAGCWLLLGCMVTLRVKSSRVIDAFNHENELRILGPEAITIPKLNSEPIKMRADIGTGFSTICVAAALLLVVSWFERYRLRKETPAPSASRVRFYDPESQEAKSMSPWYTLAHTPVVRAREKTADAEIKISAPMPAKLPSPTNSCTILETPSPTLSDDKAPWNQSGTRRIVIAPPDVQ